MTSGLLVVGKKGGAGVVKAQGVFILGDEHVLVLITLKLAKLRTLKLIMHFKCVN